MGTLFLSDIVDAMPLLGRNIPPDSSAPILLSKNLSLGPPRPRMNSPATIRQASHTCMEGFSYFISCPINVLKKGTYEQYHSHSLSMQDAHH